ncbi:MAG: phosphodiesterase, partial [Parvibaculaceae bacterium]
ALIREIFPDTAASDGGFLQDAIDLPGLRIILLDTHDPGHVAGRLDAVRLRWLEEALAGAQGRPVHLFMHHPPFPLHMAEFDSLPLAGADALRDLVTRHGRVRHIHAGHVHRFVAGSWHDIPVSVTRSTSHQTALRSGMGWTLGPERPGYAVILVEAAGTIVHFHEIEA